MKNKQKAPDIGLKDLIYIGEDGYFYYHDIPENKHRIRIAGGFRLGKNETNKPTIRYNGEQYTLNRVMYWFITDQWVDNVKPLDGNLSNYKFDNLLALETKHMKIASPNTDYGVKKIKKANGSYSYACRLKIDKTDYHLGTYPDEQSALFAAWRTRELLYPGICPIPEKIKHIVAISRFKDIQKSIQ